MVGFFRFSDYMYIIVNNDYHGDQLYIPTLSRNINFP